MGRRFQVFSLAVMLLVITVAGLTQVRVDVRLVNVVATVTDDRGRYVGNLSAEDFVVEEDGVPPKLSHFSQDQNIPVSVGILLDTSGSMDKKIRTAVDAVDRFIRQIHEDDEIFLMTFSSKPLLRQDFTSNRDKLSQALRKLWVTGGTALYDALEDGLDKLHSGTHDKRAILLITDGQDTSSLAKLDDVLRAVRKSGSLIYPIGISPLTYARGSDHVPFSWPLPSILSGKRPVSTSRRDEVDMNVLHALADNSGGRAFLLSESYIRRGAEIDKVLNAVAEELRSQYTLGYYPEHPDDGRYHSIRVRSKTGDSVRTRRGYVAGSSS